MPDGDLQREIKKKRPFESTEQEAVLNLLRTCDCVQFRFARLFREFGLTSSQYNVLRILRGEGKPLPVLEVAERMVTAVPGSRLDLSLTSAEGTSSYQFVYFFSFLIEPKPGITGIVSF